MAFEIMENIGIFRNFQVEAPPGTHGFSNHWKKVFQSVENRQRARLGGRE